MRKVIVFGFALAIAVSALAATSTVGSAQAPKIVQTGCDTLSFNPPRVHVNFAVINLSPIPVCSIHLVPIPSGPYPPCEVFECSHPDGWDCQLNAGGGADWHALPAVAGCIPPYQKLDNFDVVLDPPYYTICFQCESPTAGHVKTWGSLKAMYR